MQSSNVLIIIIIIIIIKTGPQCKTYIHTISPKTPAPQYQPMDRNKRKGKMVVDYRRDRATEANKKVLSMLLKPTCPTPPNTGSAR